MRSRGTAIHRGATGMSDVATILNNLAGLYKIQKRYSDSKKLFKRCLKIQEKELGKEHPAVATSLNNLAGLYHTQGKNTEAIPFLKRSLKIRETKLNKDHPDVAQSLCNLALVYGVMCNYSESEPLFKRCLAIREKTFGSDHPIVAKTLELYAGLLHRTDRNVEASELETRAKRILENK